MNWKILLVSAIAVIAVIDLGSLQIIGGSLATILSLIIGVIGIILPILNDLRKPKTSLHIEQPELKKREYYRKPSEIKHDQKREKVRKLARLRGKQEELDNKYDKVSDQE